MTARALVEAAQRLFLERGYDNVTVAQIADEADIAVTTLFKYFPDGKDALVFGDAESGSQRAEALVTAIRQRPVQSSAILAVRDFLRGRGPFGTDAPPIARLIGETPPLRAYARAQWEKCETPLADALAEASGGVHEPIECRAFARFALQAPDLASRAVDARAALDLIFARLDAGWSAS